MANWSRNKVDSSNLNKGKEWSLDDQVAIEELNAMINSGLYAQDFAEKLVENIDISEINNVGIPNVILIDGDGATTNRPYKKFKFINFKGEKGEAGVGATVVQTTGESTDNVMSQNAVTLALATAINGEVNSADKIVAKSFGTNTGYLKYQSGLIIQWGITNSPTDNWTGTIKFPISFTNSTSYVPVSFPSSQTVEISYSNLSNSQVTFGRSTSTGEFNIYWIAIGY